MSTRHTRSSSSSVSSFESYFSSFFFAWLVSWNSAISRIQNIVLQKQREKRQKEGKSYYRNIFDKEDRQRKETESKEGGRVNFSLLPAFTKEEMAK